MAYIEHDFPIEGLNKHRRGPAAGLQGDRGGPQPGGLVRDQEGDRTGSR